MSVYNTNGQIVASASSNTTFNAVNDPVNVLSAMKMRFNDSEGMGTYTDYSDHNLFMCAHISDLHLDSPRYNRFLKFCEDNKKYIDVAIETGDLVDYPTAETFSSMTEMETYNIELLKVVGNHEKAGFAYNGVLHTMTNAQIYAAWNFTSPNGLTYYYKDYPTQGIRIIVLNTYDTSNNEVDCHYTQAQIDWLITALHGAITNNYGVIICRHSMEFGSPIPNDKGFYQRWWQYETLFNSVCDGTPIEDLVNAFKNGGTINKTYNFTDGATPTITVDTEFSQKGEFVAYLTGHHHADLIGYSKKYSDQLYCGVGLGACKKAEEQSYYGYLNTGDTPRVDGEKSQDLFNVYAVDRKNKLLKILRVGADVNDLLQARKTTIFSY